MSEQQKTYLGDGVYAEPVNGMILLTTEDGGMVPTNAIYLESEVYDSLVAFVARLRSAPA